MSARRTFKIIIERYADGYVAYPLGVNGGVVGQGKTYRAALHDVRSAIADHLRTFGADALLDEDEQPLEVRVDQLSIDVPSAVSEMRAKAV